MQCREHLLAISQGAKLMEGRKNVKIASGWGACVAETAMSYAMGYGNPREAKPLER